MFNKVGGLRPKRHFFDKSFVYKTTMKMGELIPFLAEEVVPGDKYKIGNNAVVRVSPMVAPILDNIYIRTEYFFVPERLLCTFQDDYQNFLTGGVDGDYTGYPLGYMQKNRSKPITDFDGSLSDYFGLPRNWDNNITGKVSISKKFHNAYYKVWDEFYRDENLQDPVFNTVGTDDYYFKPLKRNWKKDYFTSALLAPLRGQAPSVPIQGILPVFGAPADLKFGPYDNTIGSIASPSGTFSSATRLFSESGGVGGYMTTAINNIVPGSGQADYYSKQGEVEGKKVGFVDKDPDDSYSQKVRGLRVNPVDMNLYASMRLSDGIGFNAADIRKLMQVQKFLERNMRAGVRLNEFLLAHFGVAPRDEVLQRPRFLGSTKTPIIISEVLQTSESTSNSPQGRLSGKGLGLSAGMIGYHSFEEPGIILGLVSIMPDLSYQSQGINKKFTRFTKYDYYFAEFAHLTEQPIKKYELVYDSVAQSDEHENTNDKTFGYQGIYDDMRHNRDMVTGQFRSDSAVSLDYWHLARFFEDVPALNSDFITCNPSNRIFEVQDEPPFQVCIGNILKAIRPMPAIAEPGLVDHF